MKRIKAKGIEVVVFEPTIKEAYFFHSRVIRDLDEFKSVSDVILCNRMSSELVDIADKGFLGIFSVLIDITRMGGFPVLAS